MDENSEMIKSSPQRRKSSSELERTERRRQGPKGRKTRIPPRRPTQRHCPNRKFQSKRKKRRLLSTSGYYHMLCNIVYVSFITNVTI